MGRALWTFFILNHIFSEDQQNDWAYCRISDIFNHIIEQIKSEIITLQGKGTNVDENIINTHAESIILEYLEVLEVIHKYMKVKLNNLY